MSRYSKKINNALKSVGHLKQKRQKSKSGKWSNSKELSYNQKAKAAKALSLNQLKQPTFTEKLLLEALIENGISFENQKPIYSPYWHYVADFFIHTKTGTRIIIELDGFAHFTKEGFDHDLRRENRMKNEYGIITLRYPNSVVLYDINRIIADILAFNPIIIESKP